MSLRSAVPYAVAVASIGGATAAFLPFFDVIKDRPGTVAFADVVIVLLLATRWRTGPALVASALGAFAWIYFFLPPYRTFSLTSLRLEDGMLLVAFIATSVFVGQLSARATRRAEEAAARRKEVERLLGDLRQENAERRHAEGALRRAHGELELRVEERTRELRRSNELLGQEVAERKRAEEVLARRSQELARSNAELEQFAYVASHDLQEPLRMVSSYVQLLERQYKDKLDGDANEFIEYAVDGAKRMQVLINDLLTYSRIDSKGHPFEATSCEDALQRALRDLRLAAEDSGASVTHDPLPTVVGDATQLTQLFQNLIANAIKFRAEAPPKVHVHADSIDGSWRIAVRDNGIGISPTHFERIFLLFQRLHSRRSYPGTGIGLAICKKIVDRHGGTIWVESEPGHGAAFFFTIPQKGEDRR